MFVKFWSPSNIGIDRKGTTFKELKSIFDGNITTKLIYEPLQSCQLTEKSREVKEKLEKKGFDIIGVEDEDEKLIGYAEKEKLAGGPISRYQKEINFDLLISPSTSIPQLLNLLCSEPHFRFVLVENDIDGIVTRADVNKLVARIYFFGVISLFELHLNSWINNYYGNDDWKKMIKKDRLKNAKDLHEQKSKRNIDLSLLECLQLCDKKVVLKGTNDFREKFDFESKGEFEQYFKDVEKIRNSLAHSQRSIVSGLEWGDFAKTISRIQQFLEKSEGIIEYNESKNEE